MGLTVPDTVDLLDRLRKDGLDVPLDRPDGGGVRGCHHWPPLPNNRKGRATIGTDHCK